jgi:hypothetical protein
MAEEKILFRAAKELPALVAPRIYLSELFQP